MGCSGVAWLFSDGLKRKTRILFGFRYPSKYKVEVLFVPVNIQFLLHSRYLKSSVTNFHSISPKLFFFPQNEVLGLNNADYNGLLFCAVFTIVLLKHRIAKDFFS